LNFTASQARAILAGRQTMTHILATPSKTIARGNGTEYKTRPFTPAIGTRIPFRYSAPLDGDAADHYERAHIIVTACTTKPSPIGAVTAEDARAAGHRTPEDLAAWWVRRHDKDWVARRERREREAGRDPAVFLRRVIGQRFAQRHADTLVWPIRFRLDEQQEPRFLLPASRGDVADDAVLGYTTIPARALEAVEVVDTATLGVAWATDAAERHTEARGDTETRRMARSLASRTRENILAAERAGVDTRDLVEQLEHVVQKIEQRRSEAA
jgi:hypothetical protein